MNIEQYLNLYSLNNHGVEHHYEFIPIKNERIFFQSFTPADPHGTVFVIHGYFDHSGSMSHLVRFLIKRQWQVMTYDLQGHGLSSGPRATINDFQDYTEVFQQIYQAKKAEAVGQIHVVSHSTGGAIVMDYLLQHDNPFHKVILVSPLVRSYAWSFSKGGMWLLKPFKSDLKRVFKKNSSNKRYLEFVKQDPLQHDRVPFAWLQSLIHWNKQLAGFESSNVKVHVLQGNQDQTVAWRYNLEWIQQKFPQMEGYLIDGANHQVFNENEGLLHCTWTILEKILK